MNKLDRKGCCDLPQPKTNQLNKAVIYRAVSQWISLAISIRSVNGKCRLKKSLKQIYEGIYTTGMTLYAWCTCKIVKLTCIAYVLHTFVQCIEVLYIIHICCILYIRIYVSNFCDIDSFFYCVCLFVCVMFLVLCGPQKKVPDGLEQVHWSQV